MIAEGNRLYHRQKRRFWRRFGAYFRMRIHRYFFADFSFSFWSCRVADASGGRAPPARTDLAVLAHLGGMTSDPHIANHPAATTTLLDGGGFNDNCFVLQLPPAA